MPAHSKASCNAHPEICDSKCKSTFNPVSDKTFAFLEKYLKNIMEIFPDNIFHLGGDELPTSCWTGSPEIQAVLTEKKWNVGDAFSNFVNKTHEMAKANGKRAVGWNEVWNQVGNRLDKDGII